jgi:hypothetical protein
LRRDSKLNHVSCYQLSSVDPRGNRDICVADVTGYAQVSTWTEAATELVRLLEESGLEAVAARHPRRKPGGPFDILYEDAAQRTLFDGN